MNAPLTFKVKTSEFNWWASTFSDTLSAYSKLGWLSQNPSDDGTTEIKLSAEYLANSSPSAIGDGNPLDDSSISYLANLDLLLCPAAPHVEIDQHGYFGQKDFSFTARIEGEREKKPLATFLAVNPPGRLSLSQFLFVSYLLQNQDDQASQIHSVGVVKAAKNRAGELYRTLVLAPRLQSLNISQASSLNPTWTGTTNHKSLHFNATVENSDGLTQIVQVDPTTVLPGQPIVPTGLGGYLTLTVEEETLFKSVSKRARNVSDKRAAALTADPHKWIPPGIEVESLDLSNFNPRVIGFEVIVPSKRIDSNSGIRWFDSDIGPTLQITIHDNDGIDRTLNLPGHISELEKLSAEIERELHNSRFDSDFSSQPISIGSALVMPTKELGQLVNTCKELVRRSEGVSDASEEAKQKRLSAIVDSEKELTKIDQAILAYDTLGSLINSKYRPHSYQADGIKFFISHFNAGNGGVLLADEMGLGKTYQILALVALVRNLEAAGRTPSKPHLIVAPKILFKNWCNEAEKFIQPGVLGKIHVLSREGLTEFTKSKYELDLARLSECNVILTNYHTLAAWQTELLKLDFGVVAFDESQDVKNPDTSKSRAARAIKADFLICSTGTPVENRLRDLWTQVDVLQRRPKNPLGELNTFVSSIESDPKQVEIVKSLLPYPNGDTFIIRREKTLIAQLPAIKIQTVLLPMTKTQLEHEKLIVAVGNGEPLRILQGLQNLYQHPRLVSGSTSSLNGTADVDDAINESPKLKWLIEILQSIKDRSEKALVFTHRTQMQELLKQVLKHKFDVNNPIINGLANQCGDGFVESIVSKFSEKTGFDLLILSPLVAGAGLNITAANHVIHYGRWWNPAKEDQASARAHRLGQTKEVSVYYPVLHHPGNIEMGFDVDLNKLVQNRRDLATDFLSPRETDITPLDMQKIFSRSAK